MSTGRTPRLAPALRAEQLLDAALAVVARDGFSALTVEAVARAAHVTRPVVYDLFSDLDGLVLALFDREEARALGPLLAIVDAPHDDVAPEAFLIDGVRTFLEAVQRAPATWQLVVFPPRGDSPEFRSRLARSRELVVDRVAALLDWGLAARGGPAGLDHGLLARVMVAVGEDAARLTLQHPRRYSPARLTAALAQLVALLPPGARPRGRPQPAMPATARAPLTPAATVADAPGPAAGMAGAPGPAAGMAGAPGPAAGMAGAPGPAAGMAGAPGPAVGMGGVRGPSSPAPAAAQAAAPRAAVTRRLPQAERRRQLLDVTLAILAHEGFGSLSVEAVARRAGVSRVVVYRSFANLEVLLLALLRREERRVRSVLESLLPADPAGKDPADLLLDSLTQLLDAVAREPLTWRLALIRPEQAPKALRAVLLRRRTALAGDLEPLIAWGVQGLPGGVADLEPELLTRALLSAAEELCRLALDDPDRPPALLLQRTWGLLDLLPWPVH